MLRSGIARTLRLLEDLDVVAVMTRLKAKQVLVQTRRAVLVTFPVRSRIAAAVAEMGFEVESADDVRSTITKDALVIEVPVVGGGGTAPPPPQTPNGPQAPKPTTTKLKVGGMTCASCSGTIETTLSKHAGVDSVVVSLLEGKATVVHHTNVLSVLGLQAAIEDCGFEATLLEEVKKGDVATADLIIEGMHCASCVGTVENVLLAADGVVGATVNLLQGTGTVRHVKLENPSENLLEDTGGLLRPPLDLSRGDEAPHQCPLGCGSRVRSLSADVRRSSADVIAF